MQTSNRRSLPRALYHITTQRHWRQIEISGVLQQGHGYGWEERKGVFALGWNNWVATRNLHYLSFLTTKLKGQDDRLVVVKIEMTPQICQRTQVALLSSGTPTSQLLLERARAGCFSTVSADQLTLLQSYQDTLVRNTFLLREFVREIPTCADPVEYIISGDVPAQQLTKVAEVHGWEIPANIMKSGRRLARLMKVRDGSQTPPTGKRPKPLVTQEDKEAFISVLLASRWRRLHRRCPRRHFDRMA